ncbi:hypothetical protein ACFLZY_01710 [Patescibacteria group bacterium]
MKKLIPLIIIISAFVGGIFLWQKYQHPERINKISDYKNRQQSFEVHNSDVNFMKRQAVCNLPGKNGYEIIDSSAVIFEHAFPFEWVDDRGGIHETITDLSVKICIIEESYKTLANYFFEAPENVEVKISGHSGLKVMMGAEGMGADVYYFELDNDISLAVVHSYVTPFYDQRLSTEVHYLPIKQQQEILDQIVNDVLQELQ